MTSSIFFFFFFFFFFTILSSLPLSDFEIFPPQQREPNIIRLHIRELLKVTDISELTPNDLSFLMQYIVEFTFLAQSWCNGLMLAWFEVAIVIF